MNNVLATNFAKTFGLGIMGYKAATTTFQVNSAMVFGTSGTSAAVRICAETSSNLTDFYFFLSAVAGTPGNVTVQLRNDNAGLPGSTIHATQTTTWAAASHWTHVTFGTPFSVTAGTLYWLVISNAAGTPGTNNFTVLQAVAGLAGTGSVNDPQFGPAAVARNTANGWIAATSVSNLPLFVAKFADGSVMGNPYTSTTAATYASNQLERGMLLDSLPFDFTIRYVQFNTTTNISTVKIYRATTAPGGTVYAGPYTVDQTTKGCYIPDLLLTRRTQYRIVATYSANSSNPGLISIEDSSADLILTTPYGNRVYDTIDNGAGGWTDTTSRIPNMSVIISRILSGGESWSA